MKKRLSIVLGVVLTLTLLLTSLTFAGGGENEVVLAQMVLDASLSEVSTVFDIPKANLEVATSRAFSFGADKFLLSSIVDKKSKQAYMVSTDEHGKVWIAEPKIEGELVDYMSQMKPEETVIVSIWAIYVRPEEKLRQIPSKYPDVPFEGYRPALGADVSPEVLDAIEADVREIKLRANEEAVQPVVDFLQSTRSKILYVSKYAPSVHAELSKNDVYKLARLPEVESISLPDEPEPGMDISAETIKADEVWDEGYDGGWAGPGIGMPPYYYQTKVAVVDYGIDFTHPALEHANGGHYSEIWSWSGTHGTRCAGCVASIGEYNGLDIKGIAHGTYLLDADFCSILPSWTLVESACDWAYDNGADVFTHSYRWGFLNIGNWDTNSCKYFDHIAYEWNRLPVCSAGNDGENPSYPYVGSPALAWNVLAVGGIDDDNSADWSDDEIADFSSWKNPRTPHNDREKPEVCAPAVYIRTTTPGGGFANVQGTSFAAPQVAGIAALLIEKNPSLKNYPELLKAIIMATANHNVDNDFPWEQEDDDDGVGTVNAWEAYKCVDQGWTWSGDKVEADLPFTIPFYARAGETVRFVINWLAHTDYDGSGDYGLRADLRLDILGGPYYPYWPTTYGTSNSYDSAWEVVQFTAPYTGTYYAKVSAPNHGEGDPWTYSGAESIAAAWYRSSEVTTLELLPEADSTSLPPPWYVIEEFSDISDLTFHGMGSPTNPLGILTFTTGYDPYYYKTGLSINSEVYDLVKIRAKSAVGGGSTAQIFWTNDEGSWSEIRSQYFTIVSDGEFHVYEIDLSEHAHWLGTCTGFRHDPVLPSGVDCEVDWIMIYGGGDGADHDLTATVYDQFGYGMEDIAVTWSISGVGSFSGTPESTTDTNGEADAVITSSVPGTSTVRCEVTGNPSVYDTATNDWTYTPKVTTVELLPEASENPVGTTHELTATVYDQFGYEMEGVPVTWSITGVGSFSGTPEIVTDADGQADAVITSSVPGTSTVRCKAQMAIILIFPGPEIDPPVYGTATKDWAYLEDFEWGLEFNGSSDHVNLPFSDNFSACTIEFWMKSSDTTNSGTPISMSDGTQHNEILLYNYNNFNLYIEGSNTGSTGVSANDGNWHHIAWTWQSSDGGTKLLRDGIEVYSGTLKAGGAPNPANLIVGQEQDSYGGGFQAEQAFLGEMDEVRIWNDVRTQTEIQDNMYSELAGNESGLAGYWKFNEAGGSVAYDTSGNGNHGTIFPACLEYALEFNGTNDYVEIPYHVDYYSNTAAVENFEWGSDGDPLSDDGGSIDWTTVQTGSGGIAEIDTSQHYSGTRSARLYSVDGSNRPSIYFSQSPIASDESIEFWFRKDTNCYAAFWHGDGAHYIRLTLHLNENIYYYDGVSHDTGADILVNTWQLFSIRNVNWVAATFDIYLGGSLIWSGATMATSASYANNIYFTNTGTDAECWIDNILVGSPSVWTFETWINRKVDNTAYERLISYSDNSGYDRFLQITTTDTVQSGFFDTTGTARQVATTDTIPLDTDVHLATSFDGTYIRIYINGILKATSASFAGKIPRNNNYPIRIARTVTSYKFEGTIDDIRNWSDVRTQDEIQANMYAELVGDEAGLVGYWKLNEGVDATATDSTANANDGIIWPLGGWALSFDGEDDYVACGAGPSFTSAITVEAWVYDRRGGYAETFVTRSTTAYGNPQFYFGANNPTSFKVALWTTTGRHDFTMSGYSLNEWHHVAFTYDGSNVVLYLDGNAGSPGAKTGTLSDPTSPVRFGMLQPTTGLYDFDGIIDEVRIWSDARTQSEIQDNMYSALEGTEQGLVGYWRINDGAGSTASDSTSNENDGTVVGADWITGADWVQYSANWVLYIPS
ncbi:MAG: S8 family serine peptidase [Dehalococcoidia bacterium]|nr:S8 family serine peptidase [Dehalococcoidia bacterium]